MPLMRLSAKIDSGVNRSITRSPRNASRIARPPTSDGSRAATTPLKNQKESSSKIGTPNISARARSWVVRSFSSLEVSAKPPKCTAMPDVCSLAGGRESALRTRGIARVASSAVANAASRTVFLPSAESSAGECVPS